MKKKLPDNQITVYQTSDGKINIEVLYANENIWLPQKRMAELFGCSADNVSLHLKNIYKDKELDESATAEDFSVVQMEGSREVTRAITCYSLQAGIQWIVAKYDLPGLIEKLHFRHFKHEPYIEKISQPGRRGH